MPRSFVGLSAAFALWALPSLSSAFPPPPTAPSQDSTEVSTEAAAFSFTEEEIRSKASFLMGAQIGSQVVEDGVDVDPETFALGVEAGIRNQLPEIDPAERDFVLMAFQRKIFQDRLEAQAEAARVAKVEAEKNLLKGKAFLAENAKRSGVRSLASGLQIELLKAGKGSKPKPSDMVKVHYEGTLIDGTKFDSSYDRGEPAVFPLNRVIAGWTEGMGELAEGSTAKLFIPAELGYGDREIGEIPPQSALVFKVELLKVLGDEDETSP